MAITMKNVIGRWLSFIIGLCAGFSIICVLCFYWDCYSNRRDLVEFTAAQVKMASEQMKIYLYFDNREDARETLNNLMNNRYIAFAHVYDKEGNLFTACYPIRAITKKEIRPPEIIKTSGNPGNGYLKISQPVVLEGKTLGMICVWVDSWRYIFY
jgi:uncharacterized membrane protein affecting hemolysin expression